jgi:hypothetical protein
MSSQQQMANDDETADAAYADERNFYKLEIWTANRNQVPRMIYAGSNLEKARALFNAAVIGRPRGQMTIRQGERVLHRHPRS